MKYIKPFTEVVALNLNDHLLQEGGITQFSVYDQDGNKDSTGGSDSGRPPMGGAKHFNAWETWD